MKNTIKLNWA